MAEEKDDLEFIPRAVRDKLDLVGIKLHLAEWRLLEDGERRRLVDQPCGSAQEVDRYRDDLNALVRARTGHAPERLPPPS